MITHAAHEHDVAFLLSAMRTADKTHDESIYRNAWDSLVDKFGWTYANMALDECCRRYDQANGEMD